MARLNIKIPIIYIKQKLETTARRIRTVNLTNPVDLNTVEIIGHRANGA